MDCGGADTALRIAFEAKENRIRADADKAVLRIHFTSARLREVVSSQSISMVSRLIATR